MKILLVEDEAPKREHIAALIMEIVESPQIKISMSVTSALDSIEEDMPDILLLDMSLPTYDIVDQESGGRPQGFGGIEVLRHMKMLDKSCPTVVITGYEAFPYEHGLLDLPALSEKLKDEFPGLLHGTLSYDSTYPEWKSELDIILNKFNQK